MNCKKESKRYLLFGCEIDCNSRLKNEIYPIVKTLPENYKKIIETPTKKYFVAVLLI